MIAPTLCIDEPLRLEALRGLCQLGSPIEERFERITRLAQTLLNAPMAAVSLVDANHQWFKSIQGLDAQQTTREVSFCGHTILQDGPMCVSNARLDPRFVDNPLVTGPPHLVAYLGVPIRSAEGYNLGSLCVLDVAPRNFTPVDVSLLEDLASLTEVELSRSMQTEAQRELMREVSTLRRASQVDDLTRVWNRAAIFEVLEAEHRRALASGRPLGVMMADVDHFKRINDTFGHATGDTVMRETAKQLLGLLRSEDAVGRYGGDEFIAVLGPGLDAGATLALAERLREGVESRIAPQARRGPATTLSVGVAFAERATDASPEALLATADAALYEAKRGGRNRVAMLRAAGHTASALDAA